VLDLEGAFVRRVAAAGLPGQFPESRLVTADDVAGLPAAVRRYLGFMEVVGRPVDRSFRVAMAGEFRRGPRDGWLPMRALQYSCAQPVARIFTMRLVFARALPMIGHDTYLAGRGAMHGRLLGAVTVAQGRGPEYDLGELTTFLDDAVLLAPSMLLGLATTWRELDADTFEVSLTDSGHTATGRVSLDERGAPRDFRSSDRFVDLPEGLVRAEWRTPVPGWTREGGRPFPMPGGAEWLLPEGPLRYVRGGFLPGTVRYDVPPPVRRVTPPARPPR
jgi:hypothetical protein